MNIKIKINWLRGSTIFSTALSCHSVITLLKRGPFWEKYISKCSIIGREVIKPSGQKTEKGRLWSDILMMIIRVFYVLSVESHLNRKDITLLISCVLWAQFKRSVPLVSTKSSTRIPQSGIELAWVLASSKILKTINLFAFFGKANTFQLFWVQKKSWFHLGETSLKGSRLTMMRLSRCPPVRQ